MALTSQTEQAKLNELEADAKRYFENGINSPKLFDIAATAATSPLAQR